MPGLPAIRQAGLGQGFRISSFEFIKLCFSIYLSLIQSVTCLNDVALKKRGLVLTHLKNIIMKKVRVKA